MLNWYLRFEMLRQEELTEVISKDETMVLSTPSGFTNESVNLSNRHRACQCIMIQCFQNQQSRFGAADTGPGMSVLDNILNTL